jgi:ectoine hydroxylase-related dioxygenase (phytanoyl-CoA dioxygenase family)
VSEVLTADQIAGFWRDGVLVVPDAVSPELLGRLQAEFNGWVKESIAYSEPYGECIDGRARFDLAPGHTSEVPALRRVQAPSEVSDAYLQALSNSRMTQMVADLIGPNVKSHHNKINSKLPRSRVTVKWHQDFPFTPHTNSDLVTALLMVDEVTSDNGPLEVAPGSHREGLHSLWHDERFTGAVAVEVAESLQGRAVQATGPAGSVCLMHTCLAHGSKPNLTPLPRTLFICVYSAADAVPCTLNPVPNAHEGLVVAGTDPGTVRATPFSVRRPEYPKNVSFFSQQSASERNQS